MPTPTISVIIPVYNAEKYLEECINSVLAQDFKDIEIIAVNDGSTDNSLHILETLAKQDSRIKIISQKNAGVSTARNTGIKTSSGKYITFCDADDYMTPTHLSVLHDSLKKTQNCQLAISSFYVLNDVSGKVTPTKPDRLKAFTWGG